MEADGELVTSRVAGTRLIAIGIVFFSVASNALLVCQLGRPFVSSSVRSPY